ncbi:uncharacterized protein VTP21DRAFT_9260 [Calcarisporiella thermophila]|uniref:uncharacterized protein n=1 Tax=Calcarisporiella thermophila TaxID=911321 RepID=UPI003742D8B8
MAGEDATSPPPLKKQRTEEGEITRHATLTSRLLESAPNELLRLKEPDISECQYCPRCFLRLAGIEDVGFYLMEEEESRLALSRPLLSSPCTLCLGILSSFDTIVEKIQTHWNSEKYDLNPDTSLGLTVSLPQGTLVRSHAANIYFSRLSKENGWRFNRRDVVDLKEIVRQCIGQKLKDVLGVGLDLQGGALKLMLEFEHQETQSDHMFLAEIEGGGISVRKVREKGKEKIVGDSRQNIVAALSKLPDSEFIKSVPFPPKPITTTSLLRQIKFKHDSIFLGGRYLKYSRTVSQTPWAPDGVRLTETSVSEIIGDHLKEAYRADEYKFVSAGREDANVRMLGSGRPFYMEIINPRQIRQQENTASLADKINAAHPDLVGVRDFTRIGASDVTEMKEGEENKSKTYSALVWSSHPVTAPQLEKLEQKYSTGFVVDQRTPLRVLQRRAPLVRPKRIHALQFKTTENPHYFIARFKTEAGTYIKELVHGDLGRTRPNIAEMIGEACDRPGECEADLIELDVVEVDLEWPPKRP